ncbi:MAG: molybdopterin synthase catalytic subunit [Halieaceae bacterium]|jgi:molybdopterin synthase catalytic subunit
MPTLTVSVRESDFDTGRLQNELLGQVQEEGAVATFTGYVRRSNNEKTVHSMRLEHYPGMTEKSIRETLEAAAGRWPVYAATAVHRVGNLAPGDQIVWVGVSAEHREAAFNACEYIMDFLKTRAPFWKKELGDDGESWVETRNSDAQRAERW